MDSHYGAIIEVSEGCHKVAAREDGLNLSGKSNRTGPPDGYYDTGRKDSKGRPIYKKVQGRAAAGGGSVPPSSQTPMDDHNAPKVSTVEDDFSGDISIEQEINGVLGDHENVKGISKGKDGVHEISFNSGARIFVEPESDHEVALSLEAYDDEGERIEKEVIIQRSDLGEALTQIADSDGNEDEDGGGIGSMLPLMAAEGLLGRRGRRFRRKRRGGGGGEQRGLSAYLIRRFFSMVIPWREH